MPLLQITADESRSPVLHEGGTALRPALMRALSRPECGTGPVVVMIHGYKYQPGHPVHCPHRSLLSLLPDPEADAALSWPRHLGFGGDAPDEGLALAFGWPARGSIWQAYDAAEAAGTALARLVGSVQRSAPDRPLHIVAHSLGCRVALSALAECAEGSVRNLLLLAGAEYGTAAMAALRSPAGRTASVLNVTSRENDLFDFLMETLVPPPARRDRMLGHGSAHARNLVTLQLDHPDSLKALRDHGYPIKEPARRICHWSPYSRPGVFPLYRAILSGRLGLGQLRALLPQDSAPRWSRLLPHRLVQMRTAQRLPFPTKAS